MLNSLTHITQCNDHFYFLFLFLFFLFSFSHTYVSIPQDDNVRGFIAGIYMKPLVLFSLAL